MKKSKSSFDRDYLKRCKESPPEIKLRWLADAKEFADAKKRVKNKQT